MKKLFKWVLILTVALAVGVVVIVYNPGLFKAPLERYLSGVAGYSIHLDGELEIDPGRLTRLSATGIRVSAPVWSSHPDLLVVGQLELVLDTGSLFEDMVILDSLQMDKVQANLETDVNGYGNWMPTTAQPAETENTGATPVVVLKTIDLNNSDLRFLNGEKGIEHLLHISSLDQNQQSDGMLNIKLDAEFNKRPVAFEGSIGPYENLLQGHDIAYAGSGNFGSLKISGNGLIDEFLKPRHPQFNLEIQGPNIDEVTAMFGAEDLGSGVFSFRARGEEVNGQYEAGIHGKIGDLSLDISAHASDLSELNELNLRLSANGPNIGTVMGSVGIDHWPDQPFSLKGDIERIGRTLNISQLTLGIGGTRLVLDALLSNFPNFDASRIRLDIEGDDADQFRELLGIPGIATGPFEVRGKLDVTAEEIELLQVELKTSLGLLTVSGTLGDSPAYIGSKLHVHLEGHNAHMLMSIFGIDALPDDAFDMDAIFETTQNGLLLERSVLVTNKNERLEIAGYLSFEPGSLGTAVDVKFDGQHLSQLLQNLIPGMEIPDLPYHLSGHIGVQEEAINLENIEAIFADIELGVSGLISLQDGLIGSSLDLGIGGSDFSSLQNIPILANSLEMFVPGQSYRATGTFGIVSNGWKLDRVSGRIGETQVDLDGLISKQADWAGSNLDFSLKGPDLHGFLVKYSEAYMPLGTFETSGQVFLAGDKLSINGFIFDSEKARAKLDLEIDRPLSNAVDVDFNLDLSGEDIRNLLPRTDSFEPAEAAFKIQTVGHRQGELISLEHFDADIGDLKISLRGDLGTDSADENVKISFTATSNDLSTFGRINGNQLPSMALDIKADVKGTASQFVVQNLAGTLGESNIAGNLDVSLTGSKPIIDVVARSTYLDIQPYLRKTDTDKEEPNETKNKRLIPATPLPLEALNAADITLDLSIDELRVNNDSFNNLLLEAVVFAGGLEVPKFTLVGSRQGRMETSLSVKPVETGKADVKFDLQAERITLNLAGQTEDKLSELPVYDFDFHVSGTGGNLQDLAASLNGSLRMGSEGGSLGDVSLGMLDFFILEELFSLIMPKSPQDDMLDITCFASALSITDGLVKTDPAIAYSTNKLIIISKGTLDLETEKLNLNFNATPTKVFKISAGELFNPYILISGTLADVDVGLDPAKVILHGGVAVGTAGISILAKGLIDRMGTASPLCEEMLEEARQHRQ